MERLAWPMGKILSFLTKQYISRVTASFQGTPVERYYFALYMIAKKSGKITQQELADTLLIDKVSVVRILDILTEEDLIERTVNPKDRRQHLLHVKPKAEPWISRINEVLEENNDFFLSMIDEQYRDGFIEGIKQLVMGSKDIPSDSIKLYLTKNNTNND
jgi:MarR family transcriptional regulator for hemolysin